MSCVITSITSLYKNVINKLKKDKLVKNILMIIGGTASGQVIGIVVSPILTRIYTPEEYGILSVFTSILLIMSFSSLKYEMAIPLAKEDDDAVNILVLSLIVLGVFTVILGIALIFWGQELLRFLNANAMYSYRFFIPLGLLFQGLYAIFMQWMFRKKQFKVVSKTMVTQVASGSIIKVLGGFLNFGAIGLIVGRIVSVSAGTFKFFKNFIKNQHNVKEKISLSKIKYNAKRYIDFPLYQASSIGVGQFRNQLPVLFLAPLFGSQIVGFYGLANTIIKIPARLVGKSVMDVFFAEIASLGKENPKQIKNLANSLIKKLIIIGLIIVAGLAVLGPIVFSLVFGSEWYEAGIFARILSIYIFANIVFLPISRIFEVFEKQRLKLIIDIFSLAIVSLVFFLAGMLSWSVNVTIFLYSITMFMIYLVTYLISQMILNSYIKNDTTNINN